MSVRKPLKKSEFLKAEDVAPSDGFTVVGKLQKAHGIKGEIYVLIFAKEAAWMDKLESIRLVQPKLKKISKTSYEKPTSKLNQDSFDYFEYSIRSKRWHKEGIIFRSNDIRDRNRAEELVGSFFEIPEEFFVSKEDEEIYLREVLGFQVFDGENSVGVVTGFNSNGIQDLLVVESGEKEFEIPFVDQLIVEISNGEKTIRMNLPEGLMDL